MMSTQALLFDFLQFLRKPHTEPLFHHKKQALFLSFKLWLYLFVFIIFGGVFLDSLVDIPMHDRFEEVMEQIGIWGFVGFAVILGPFLEEIAFRLAMRFRLRNVIVGVIAFIAYMTQAASYPAEKMSSNGTLYLYTFSGLLLVGFLILCTKYPSLLANWWTAHFPLVFYVASVSFALIHIFNFEEFPLRVVLLAPLITLPQFVLGLGMGYLRLRFGFWYGYLFHVLNNGFAVSIYLLLQ
ncbi:CPBP family glutamic-type intramembrane protease [Myroides fluvii]|uniref:CPBP family glutamic-type intramembrane protease n=1 Tax=Myroides fluvii TaxID=2572594 RepID=UPI001E571705|nr:CPBP family glutamic-type intramembrane protease [Myroides fluvii]